MTHSLYVVALLSLFIGAGCVTSQKAEVNTGVKEVSPETGTSTGEVATQDTTSASDVAPALVFDDPPTDRTLDVTVGQPFSISLESNSTTGYRWRAEFSEAELTTTGSDYFPFPNEEKVVGSGGKEMHTFILLKRGSVKLKMVYAQPWNPDQDKARVREYTISSK
jgi:predicted secreted protein